MGSIPLHYIDLRTFCYETEAEQRVETALREFLPPDYPIDRDETEGHHGDRIVILSTRVDNADDIRAVMDVIRSTDEFDQLQNEIEDRVTEECSLFITFDKQAAYHGDISVGQGIRIRGKIEAYPAKQDLAIENAKSLLNE